MLVKEMITQIRDQLHDITEEYSDDVLIKYINTGIKSASYILAQHNSSQLLKEITVNDGDDRPSDLLHFAGVYPLEIQDNKIRLYDEYNTPLTLRYFASKENVSKPEDELPFSDEGVLIYIEQYASILAGNRNEFNEQQDTGLAQALRDELLANTQIEQWN